MSYSSIDRSSLPPGLADVTSFGLVEALYGRRSRRFSMGVASPDNPLGYASEHEPVALTELEELLVLNSMAGNTGWHSSIKGSPLYAPHVSNYSAAAGGRAMPSAAGYHTTELFFTNDSGTWMFPTRDAPALVDEIPDSEGSLLNALEAHGKRVRKLSDKRIPTPPREPYIIAHNTWCANVPGSTLIIPVGDVAQQMIALLCFLVQNGHCIYDDINDRKIPGLERFADLVDVEEPARALSYMETYALTECTAELSCSCLTGMLMLQAMGLGGWMFDGINRFALYGAMDDPEAPGLGFAFEQRDGWTIPNPTGIPGVYEGLSPPHYPDMRAAVEAFAERKFGPGGPYNPDTPGPWKDSRGVRSSAQVHSEEFKDCVGVMAQYIYDTFGKFPGTVPTIFSMTFLQVHHLDIDYYDELFEPGHLLDTHRSHMERWH